MTNDEMELLREFRSGISAPSEEARQRAHAYAASRSRSRLSLRLRNLATSRVRVYAIATACVFLAAGLSFALIPQSGHAPRAGRGDPLQGLTLIPDGPIGSSIGVEMKAPVGNATLQLQVLRATYPPDVDPNSFHPDWKVVYQKQVPMTEVTKGDAAKGDNPLSTWSGTLSTSDWSGGCQKDGFIYSINATVLDSNGTPAAVDKGDWLTCAG